MRLLVALLAGAAIAACLVDRRTNDFQCSRDEDCLGYDPQRVCDPDVGYCVEGDNPSECPDACNGGCEPISRTCITSCPTPSACPGLIVCPDGWTCMISCGTNGCNNIDCRGSADCTIVCNGSNACSNIDCGGSDESQCNVTCNGANACSSVDCQSSRCDVTCGANSCGFVDCDNACRCQVSCADVTACDNVDCPDLDCESQNGCAPDQTGCPTTCS